MKRLSQEDDQVIFLLCKQSEELYVLEVHLKDGMRPRTVTKHHLRLQSPTYGNNLLDFLGSNEFFDISDLCELQIDLENQQVPPEEYRDEGESEGDLSLGASSRPSTFSSISSTKSSRPQSGISEFSTASSGSSQASFESLLWENEIEQLKDFTELTKSDKKSIGMRPATALSIMRLPFGARPMVIVPKTRPATAEKWIDGFKSHLQSNTHLFEEQLADLSSSTSSISGSDNSLEFFKSHLAQPPSPKSKTTHRRNTAQKVKKTMTGSPGQLLQFLTNTKSTQPSRKTTPRKESTPRLKTPAKPQVAIVKRSCCSQCNKKLGPAQRYLCKCEQFFCSLHRYSDRHECSYDYKTAARPLLIESNPVVVKEKLVRL